MFRFRYRPRHAGSLVLLALGAAVVPFASLPLPHAAHIGATLVCIVACAALATAGVLGATFRRAPRRSTCALAFVYAALGVIALLQAAVVPGIPGPGQFASANGRLSPWLWSAWHALLPLGTLAYAALRVPFERELPPREAAGFARRVAWAAGAAVAAAAVPLIVLAPQLPPLTLPGAIVATGVAPALLALSAIALLALQRLHDRDAFDVALARALIAFGIDVALHAVDDRRFIAAWYAGRAFALAGSAFVLTAAIRELLGWRDRAIGLESLLARESRRAERHAERLRQLWRLGSVPADDDAFIAALLEEAAGALHEGRRFAGSLARIEAADFVLEVVPDAVGLLQPGARFPIDDSLLGIVVREGLTVASRDFRADPRFTGMKALTTIASRAGIATPFTVGDATYVLGFVSPVPLDGVFELHDHAYVETVASLCAGRLQQREHAHRLRHQAEHDALTGIPNRATFRARGMAALSQNPTLALAVIDIDRFRDVNELYGQPNGDAVLVEVAARLFGRSANGETVGRIGADAFGVVFVAAGADEAQRRTERYLSAFAAPFVAGDAGERTRLTASAGLVVAPEDGAGFDQLLRRADSALREAKTRGGGRVARFDPLAEHAFIAARRLQTELAEALARDEFVLHFQPHVALRDGRVTGAEALVRWRHPRRGLLGPAAFIPLAEEQGLLGAIGAWVAAETVRASRGWRLADDGFRVWYNLSAHELDDPALLRRLEALGENLGGVGVEITETAAMRDASRSMRTIAALRDAGLRIALDDFGTGYSSLAQLKRLPIDVVKIDRAFVDGVPDDGHDDAIVEAVVSIASRFGFETVAEGVETPEQAAFLARAGCTHGQGFHYARPMEAAAFDAWLAARTVPAGRR